MNDVVTILVIIGATTIVFLAGLGLFSLIAMFVYMWNNIDK